MRTRLEWKVGLFVFVCLAVLAGLLIQFSKGMSLFRPMYTIILQSSNVSGLKVGAPVMMSGVQIGRVSEISLAPSGRTAAATLSIYSKYQIHMDARFVFQTAGLLGDEYVSIVPTENQAKVYRNGSLAKAEPPIQFEQIARTAGNLAETVDETVQRLNSLIADVHRLLLNETTLTNMAQAVANLREVSSRASITVSRINDLLSTNSAPFSLSVSNFAVFSEHLNGFGSGVQELLTTNSDNITAAIGNLRYSTGILTNLLDQVQAGKGLAGALISDDELAAQVAELARNLSITSSNLNRLGVWGVLWRHKPPRQRSSEPPEPLTSPKNPFH